VFSACLYDARMMFQGALSIMQTWQRSWTRGRMLLWNFRWSSLSAILGESPLGLLVSSRLGTDLHDVFYNILCVMVCLRQATNH